MPFPPAIDPGRRVCIGDFMVPMESNKSQPANAAGLIAAQPSDKSFDDHYLTKDQLADRLGLTRRGVECLMARRKIPAVRLGWRTVRFNWKAVEVALGKLEVKSV